MQALKRIWNSRGARKFFRSRSAVLALMVIAIYFCIGFAVMLGAVSKEDWQNPVATKSLPGAFLLDTPEKRYDNAIYSMFYNVERALNRDNPKEALKEVKLGKLRAAKFDENTEITDERVAELRKIVAEVNEIKKEFTQCENLDKDPAMLPAIERLEDKVAELVTPLTTSGNFSRNLSLCLGTDSQGRSIFYHAVYSIKIALSIGIVTATISIFIGGLLGAIAGYFGGWIDHLIVWIYTTFSSIPGLVLLVVIAYAFAGLAIKVPFSDVLLKDTLFPVYVAFCATFWIGTCRVIRGEAMKLRQMEYVQAAKTTGFGSFYILLRHVLPNTAHLLLINFSLLLIGAIKSEVILSFLGLGVKSQPSWGTMISDANATSEVMNGFFWQIGAATAFMFVLVLAFNILSDALQDALDPKHL